MFEQPDPKTHDVDDLVDAYLNELSAVFESGPAERTDDIPKSISRTIDEGNAAVLTVADAARVLATESDRLDSDAIEAELHDRLLIAMSNAVMDVDTLAERVTLDRSPKELQQAIEGRASLSMLEYAHIRRALARNGR